jgi:hypothetical protein
MNYVMVIKFIPKLGYSIKSTGFTIDGVEGYHFYVRYSDIKNIWKNIFL